MTTPQYLIAVIEPALKAANLTTLLPVVPNEDDSGIIFGGPDGELGISIGENGVLLPWFVQHYPGSRDIPPDSDIVSVPTPRKLYRAADAVEATLAMWLSLTVVQDVSMNEYAYGVTEE